jgi:uncharacterized membrane protein YedE/YeeE
VNLRTLAIVLISGMLFGFGLALATMIKPEVVLSFLLFQDLGLLFVLGGAATVTALFYQFVPKIMRKPVLGMQFGKHPSSMSWQTIGGAALFGIGWGLAGVCPGPAIAALGAGNWPVAFALLGMFCGSYLQGWVASRASASPPATGSVSAH